MSQKGSGPPQVHPPPRRGPGKNQPFEAKSLTVPFEKILDFDDNRLPVDLGRPRLRSKAFPQISEIPREEGSQSRRITMSKNLASNTAEKLFDHSEEQTARKIQTTGKNHTVVLNLRSEKRASNPMPCHLLENASPLNE